METGLFTIFVEFLLGLELEGNVELSTLLSIAARATSRSMGINNDDLHTLKSSI